MYDLRHPTTLMADRAVAQQRVAADKAELHRLESTRHSEEQRSEKYRLRDASAARVRRQHCNALLLRKKWLDEDRRATTSRSNKGFSKKARRLAEKYAAECPG